MVQNENDIQSKRRGRLADLAPAPIFVLVAPQMGENIGATARGMLNFGISALRLVNPRDGWPNEKAGAMAAGAGPVIDHTQVFATTAQAIHDCHFVVATTARRREMSLPVWSPQETATALRHRIARGQSCAILFGAERAGLSSEDVAHADAIVSIPVNPTFASLNLAQAAVLLAYEWGQASQTGVPTAAMAPPRPASRADLTRFLDRLIGALDESGYFFPERKKTVMERNLRIAFTRVGFTDDEIQSLHGVIKSLVRNAVGRSDL